MAERPKGGRRRFLRQMPVGGGCAEIGVWEGDFSARILDETRPRRLHLVDPWRYATEASYQGAWYAGGRAQDQADMDAVYDRVVGRFAAETAAGTVVVHRAASAEAAGAFEDASLDWIYIDGDHLYDAVKLDLELWTPKVKPGGLVAGDDYGEGGWWEGGVKRAVDEFVARVGCETTIIGRQFILKLP